MAGSHSVGFNVGVKGGFCRLWSASCQLEWILIIFMLDKVSECPQKLLQQHNPHLCYPAACAICSKHSYFGQKRINIFQLPFVVT